MNTQFSDESEIESLVQRFRTCTLPAAEWTHEAHLVTGIWFLRNYTQEEATCYLRSGIITYNASVGGENTPSGGYHETLTLFWIGVMNHFLSQSRHQELSLWELCQAFLNSPWADKHLPFTYYTKDHLLSTKGRARWVDPDVKNFEFVV